MSNSVSSFGYCTNVHAGSSLDQAKENLERHAVSVRQQVQPNGLFPVGLWLSEPVADAMIAGGQVREFGDWLGQHGLVPYTFNGFPQGDFHQPVVKHAVYEPTWCCQSRARYTMCLAEIMEAILPSGQSGSISTLPLGWPHAPWHAENLKNAADNLLQVAHFLQRLTDKNGCEIALAIEPEPGCVLNTAVELVEFFEHYLFSGADEEIARRYLTVCHDICHSGVMFEPQVEALELYRNSGIRIGKVQVSSAVHVPWDQCTGDAEQQARMLEQLRGFDEPKYLHQTTRSNAAGKLDALSPDLPSALAQWLPGKSTIAYPDQPWRVHFHVPIFVEQFGQLSTTQSDIWDATQYLESHAQESVAGAPWFTSHYEVETYAWPVLPSSLAENDLASGIAKELRYFASVKQKCTPASTV
ncbi:MAG: metabolite traffic protein EboE [Pirellulaceae bacterium]